LKNLNAFLSRSPCDSQMPATLQHTSTHSNTNPLQHTAALSTRSVIIIAVAVTSILDEFAPLDVLLQHTATLCNTLQHTPTHYNTLQHTSTHSNTLQHTVNQIRRHHHHRHCQYPWRVCATCRAAPECEEEAAAAGRGLSTSNFGFPLHSDLWKETKIHTYVFVELNVCTCIFLNMSQRLGAFSRETLVSVACRSLKNMKWIYPHTCFP